MNQDETNQNQIPFTQTFYSKPEEQYVLKALHSGRLEGDGVYTKKVHGFFEERYKVAKALFTTSCTDALELAALLCDINPGDEVIVPSYTFVSSAHAFALRGAKIVFADSRPDHPNISIDEIEKLITNKTKVIVPVHYAGFSCEMDKIMSLAKEHNLIVVEDAAQAIESKFQNKAVGTMGHLSAFSFHQTKNISCGEGGLLLINDPRFIKRAEIIREKGTNRSAFFRGEVDKYTCVDLGSSFLASDLNASLLYGQLERIDEIQKQRLEIWKNYFTAFKEIEHKVERPKILDECEHNAHCFYLITQNLDQRTRLIQFLKENKISAPFHYINLHLSPFYSKHHDGRKLVFSEKYTDCLVRLPLFAGLKLEDQQRVIENVKTFFKGENERA